MKNIQDIIEQTQLVHAEADLLEAKLRLKALQKLEDDKEFYKKMEQIQKGGNK